MEPMALGSPAGSPAQTPNSHTANSAYLPGFLLGDVTPQSRIGIASPEPNRFSHSGHISPPTPISSYGTPDYRLSRQKAMFGGSNPGAGQMATESQVNGPPTKTLYESLDTRPSLGATPHNASLANQSMNQSRLLGGQLANTTYTSPFSETPLNQTLNESTQGLLQWITIFGFPPSALTTVLSHISSRVRITDKHPAPHPQSNWLHLKCSSEQEAQRALSCNGNIVSGCVMIGVIPCTDEGVIMSGDKENRAGATNESLRLFSTPSQSRQSGIGIAGGNARTPVRMQSARPLVAGYSQMASAQAVRTPDNVPQKQTGIVTKAMEYVFGW